MLALPWTELLLFMVTIALLALYGLTVSGHFPVEFRADELRRGGGALLMWGTILLAGVAAATSLVAAWAVLPWYAIVIGGGAMLLAAPLLLQRLPDSFVNGRAGLAVFAGGAAVTTLMLWSVA